MYAQLLDIRPVKIISFLAKKSNHSTSPLKTRGSLAKQSDCFCHAKTKRPKRKIMLAAYNRKKILPRYPVNLKLYRKKKLKILNGLGDTSNYKFYHFCQKFENSKWLPFLEGGKFF